ncbi:hypothetical protein F5883DRAFT_431241 [Diaporthe sp. PMI_573]|nr:hypothetical protein F5883DRAFT_431241 [Diaporthaceae sp. PMI_573]
MRSALALALLPFTRGLPARQSFLVAPSYKSTVAVRGFATATASKTTGRAAATKTKAAPTAKATTTKPKKTAKAPAKKNKAAAKPKKPVGRKKKELSPEEQKLVLRRELRKKSLVGKEPKRLPDTKWMVYMSAALKGKPTSGLAEVRVRMSELSIEFKTLSPAELERLEETVTQNKAANAANWKTWIEIHSIKEIQEANRARRRLKREFDVRVFPLRLVDERLPKRPANNAYAYFVKAKRTGVHDGLWSKETTEGWRALSAAEKKPYEDLAAAERARFAKEMEKLTI